MAAGLKQTSSRRKVLIIYTGGTFGMDSEMRTRGGTGGWLEPVALKVSGLSPESLRKRVLAQVPELGNLAECTIDVALNRDSAHIGPDDWIALAKRVRSSWSKYDGIVILHGTDTLAYTASALSFLLQPCLKPVILTGAQRPLSALLTDARRNLIAAVEIAAYGPRPLVDRVLVFFDDRLLLGNRTRKLSATEFHAFDSPGCEPLASVGTHLSYSTKARVPSGSKAVRGLKLKPRFSRQILELRVTPGFPARALSDGLFNRGHSILGLILEVFPSGTAPTHDAEFMAFLKLAHDRRVPVILATEGNPSLYEAGRALLKAGARWAGPMTPECAYVKTALLLAQPQGLAKFEKYWGLSLAGER